MLWNFIRDFFVQYIFGGCLSDGTFVSDAYFGQITLYSSGTFEDTYLTESSSVGFFNIINDVNYGESNVTTFLSIGDWLSTTATIITMVGFCIFLFMIIRWFFRIGSGLISYR